MRIVWIYYEQSVNIYCYFYVEKRKKGNKNAKKNKKSKKG